MDNKLRYRIDSWNDLRECLSNNSRDLSIHVTHMLNDSRISGTRISVVHSDYGVLFSYIVSPSGDMITPDIDSISTEQLFKELSKFGFLVEFSDKVDISVTQLVCLRGAYELGFDKVRVLSTWHTELGQKVFKKYVVAFHDSFNQDWLNNGYSAPDSEFNSATVSGQAINLSTLSLVHNHNWSWLEGYVMNINDILSTHSDELYAVDRRSLSEREDNHEC